MEPTIGLEPMNCLREDLTLRMLLCSIGRYAAVSVYFGWIREGILQQFVRQFLTGSVFRTLIGGFAAPQHHPLPDAVALSWTTQ